MTTAHYERFDDLRRRKRTGICDQVCDLARQFAEGEILGRQRFVSLDGVQDFLRLSGLTAGEIGRFETAGGREVLAEIKADEKLAGIPVVVLTASTSEEDLLRAQALQADSYITKPVEFMGFLDVVREVESFHLFVVTLPPMRHLGTPLW